MALRRAVVLLLVLGAPFALSRDFSDIESWADELIMPALEAGRVGGVSIGLVENGEVTFLKGYGWEHQGNGVPLDPRNTVFRMCSVTKSFVSTTIMQLVEEGKIGSLDDPVNDYLKRFQLPPPHGDQVTLRQLMTHTSGMAGHGSPQGTTIDMPTPVSEGVVAQYFIENIERPPGTVRQYANLGVSLQGVVIEDVSGEEISQRIARRILQPLGMTSSQLHYSTATPDRLAVPHGRFPNGELQAVPFYPKHPLGAAAGGILATTADMLKYAAFHADETGETHGDVLTGASRATMHRAHHQYNDADVGVGLHLNPANYGGTRIARHGCGLPGTNSTLAVMPEIRTGLVITVLATDPIPPTANLTDAIFSTGLYEPSADYKDVDLLGSGDIWMDFTKRFLGERIRPEVAPDYAAPRAVTDLKAFEGSYWTERRSMRKASTFFGLGSMEEVKLAGPGKLTFKDSEYTQLAPGIFEKEESGSRIYFRQPWDGSPVFVHDDSNASYRQVSGLGNPALVVPLLGAGLLLSLLGLFAVARPAGVLQSSWPRRIALVLPVLVILLPVVTLMGTELSVDAFLLARNGVRTGFDAMLWVLRIHVVLGAVLTAMIVYSWWQGANSPRPLTRVLEVVLALAGIVTIPGALLLNLFASW